MLVEVCFQLVVFINRIHSQSQDGISRQLSKASQSLYEFGDTSFWYNVVVTCKLAICKHPRVNNLPSFRYYHEIDKTLISYEDCNKIICHEIWKSYT